MMAHRTVVLAAAVAALLAGCTATRPAPTSPHDAFLAALKQHCGKAYAGRRFA